MLAQKNADPRVGDMKQLDQAVAWVAHNSDRKISAPVLKHTHFDVYSDSDHAGDKEETTRSHTGVVILCNGAPVSWRSKKQPVTAVSSAAAEIYAMAEAARDARLNAWRSEELGYKRDYPIHINVDNAAGVTFQTKMCADSKLLGMIDIRWNWVQELQDAKEVKAVKIATDRNIADLLTKCHSRRTYEHLIGLALEKAKEYASTAVASNLAI